MPGGLHPKQIKGNIMNAQSINSIFKNHFVDQAASAAANLAFQLAGFTGSETMYQHTINRNVIYTEGVRHFAQNAGHGAYWLLDIMATEPKILRQQREFALVKLVAKNGKAKLTVDDGNDGSEPVYKKNISFTDCPDGEWKFYFIEGTILLPSEY
jgi:hypothetical protein